MIASSTDLTYAPTLGPMRIGSPRPGPIRHIKCQYGDMWQVVGDGAPLISVVVAVKRTPIESVDGLRGHLDWEAQRQVANTRTLDLALATADLPEADETWISGARHAAKVVFNTARGGLRLHNIIVASAAAGEMQRTHVATMNTELGREMADAMASTMCLVDGLADQ